MTRRLVIAVACVIALAVGIGARSIGTSNAPAPSAPAAGARGIDPAFIDALARTGRTAKLPFASSAAGDDGGEVAIAGAVVDATNGAPVGNVEVVFRSEAGEQSVVAGADGRYRIALPRGRYRAFVRDDSVLSAGRPEITRLPGLPSVDEVSAPDEGLMPIVVAMRDADHVDLAVVRGGTITGQVMDPRGQPIASAVVRARGGVARPALGTDVAETDAAGRFELRLPAGAYTLEAAHDRYAGINGSPEPIVVEPGSTEARTLAMTAGCVISGRVVDPRGMPSGDGAIEKRWGKTDLEFGPAGRIAPDGSFRWVSTDAIDVTLRAWPWKSPPSASRTFSCRDGARFTDVVFQLENRAPDLEGTLADETGAPVPFAFVDLSPLDPGGIGQQERTDAEGHWQVFRMPAGRYRVSASARGHGVAAETILAPKRDVSLRLGGVGRIEGTTSLLANGAFVLEGMACADENRERGGILVAEPRRLVQVIGGRFSIDDVPACAIQALATWRAQRVRFDVSILANATGTVELAIGPPPAKTVHGTVRDESGRPVSDVLITAYHAEGEASVRTDATGRYSLRTFSRAAIVADDGTTAATYVSTDDVVDDETIDIDLVREAREGWED